jgi:hypothetical protein
LGDNQVAIGAEQFNLAYYGAAVGYGVRAYHHGAFTAPPRVISRTDLNYSATAPYQSHTAHGSLVQLTFPPMDIGAVPSWTTPTNYYDQDVVVGAAHTGTKQAFFVYGGNGTDTFADFVYDGDAGAGNNAITSTTTPTFSDAVGGTAADPVDGGDHGWMTIDPASGVTIDPSRLGNAISGSRYLFVPTKLGIYIMNTVGTITGDPTVSFGNQSNATVYANNVTITTITDSGGHELIWVAAELGGSLAPIPAAETLVFTLNTAGTGSSIHCRPIVEGYYMPLEQ